MRVVSRDVIERSSETRVIFFQIPFMPAQAPWRVSAPRLGINTQLHHVTAATAEPKSRVIGGGGRVICALEPAGQRSPTEGCVTGTAPEPHLTATPRSNSACPAAPPSSARRLACGEAWSPEGV